MDRHLKITSDFKMLLRCRVKTCGFHFVHIFSGGGVEGVVISSLAKFRGIGATSNKKTDKLIALSEYLFTATSATFLKHHLQKSDTVDMCQAAPGGQRRSKSLWIRCDF